MIFLGEVSQGDPKEAETNHLFDERFRQLIEWSDRYKIDPPEANRLALAINSDPRCSSDEARAPFLRRLSPLLDTLHSYADQAGKPGEDTIAGFAGILSAVAADMDPSEMLPFVSVPVMRGQTTIAKSAAVIESLNGPIEVVVNTFFGPRIRYHTHGVNVGMSGPVGNPMQETPELIHRVYSTAPNSLKVLPDRLMEITYRPGEVVLTQVGAIHTIQTPYFDDQPPPLATSIHVYIPDPHVIAKLAGSHLGEVLKNRTRIFFTEDSDTATAANVLGRSNQSCCDGTQYGFAVNTVELTRQDLRDYLLTELAPVRQLFSA